MARITVGLLRELEKQVMQGEISYSRMVEMLNEQAKLDENLEYEYIKITSNQVAWRGDRYFKFKWNDNKVIQVCLEINNETKRGKGHYVGIYEISRISMISNWSPKFTEKCTKEEFDEAFNKAIELLKK